jgi:hypothetical protein
MGHDSLFNALLMFAWLWLCMLGWWAWRHGRPAPLQGRCNNVSLREIIASPGSILWAPVQIMWAGGLGENQ